MMNKKYLMIILASLVFLSLFLSGCSQKVSGTSGSSQSTGDIIQNVLTLQFLADIGIIPAPINPIEGFVRFLLLVALVIGLAYLGQKIGMGQGISIGLASIISLASIIFVPSTVLVAAAVSYSMVVSFVILGLPILLLGLTFFLLKEHKWLRVLVIALLFGTLLIMQSYISGMVDALGGVQGGIMHSVGVAAGAITPGMEHWAVVIDQVDSYIWWAIGITLVIGIWSVISAIGFKAGTGTSNFIKRFAHKQLQKYPSTAAGLRLRHEKRDKTRILRDLAAATEVEDKIESVTKHLELYRADIKTIKTAAATPQIRSRAFWDNFNNLFNNFKDEFGELFKAEKDWKRAKRREVSETRKLIDELGQNGAPSSDITSLSAAEAIVLNKFIEVESNIKKVNTRLKKIEKAHSKLYSDATVPVGAAGPVNLTATEQNKLNTIEADSTNCKTLLDKAKKAEKDAKNGTATVSESLKNIAKDLKSKWMTAPKEE